MVSVVLTGGVASGKSEVLRVWEAAGVPAVSADELSRRAVQPGSEGLEEVRRAFGADVIGSDGGLDRARLRAHVFQDDAARQRLEAILQPRIGQLRERWLHARAAEGRPLVASEIPLLFEVGLERAFDVSVTVDAPDEQRLRRMVEGRGLTEAEARRIMAVQMDPAERRRRAHQVIVNDGSLAELEVRSLALLERLRRDAGITHASAHASRSATPNTDLRIDFHMHTWGSHDCLSHPEAVLAAARSREVGRIALTDHDRLDVALAMAERHPEAVIPAEEVRTAEGIDVIGLYLRVEIPRGTPAREVCDRVHEQGGLVYLPHPYAEGKGGGGRHAESLVPHVDVIEVFNGRLHHASQNARAAELARRHGCLRGAGSDAHTVGEVGRSWVELPSHPNQPAALIEALAQGRVHGTTASRWVHLASTWAKIRRRLPGAPDTARERPGPTGERTAPR